MSVARINKTEDYTVMSNSHFKNTEMSLKAKGLLSLMLSLPDNWDYSIAGLVTLSKDGKDSVMSALEELERFGYLERTRVTKQDGKFDGYIYDIYEEPKTVKPYAENPNTDKPNTENPPQSNTNTSNTKKTKTKESNKHRVIKAFPCLESLENFNDELLDTLQDFVDMRKKQKSPMSEKAMKLLMSKLHELSGGNVQNMIELLNQSILNGWKSIYPVKTPYTSKEDIVANRVDVVDSWI